MGEDKNSLLGSFVALGLSEQKAKETLKNETVTANLSSALEECGRVGGVPEGRGSLLYHLASKAKKQVAHHIPVVARHICGGKVDTVERVEAALEYLLAHLNEEKVDEAALGEHCGFGVKV